MLPQCKAVYDYDANDTDELTFKEGDTIELVKKGKKHHSIYPYWAFWCKNDCIYFLHMHTYI